jgi:hypothetical protein
MICITLLGGLMSPFESVNGFGSTVRRGRQTVPRAPWTYLSILSRTPLRISVRVFSGLMAIGGFGTAVKRYALPSVFHDKSMPL